MPFLEALRLALQAIWGAKLRSFFTLLGIIVSVGLLVDEQVRVIAKRPLISAEDAAVVARALPDAKAVALQSGWPTPISDASYRDRTLGNVLVFGVTPPYQIVQDYQMLAGGPPTQPGLRRR